MKKHEVKIGSVYIARVSGKLARVKIERESRYGGWMARNLDTNRPVRIQRATRLRAAEPEVAATAAQEAAVAENAATVAPPGAQVAPKKAGSSKEATARPGSKKAQVIELLRQPEGATLQALMSVTHWRPHSVRGFLSTLSKKLGHNINRVKRDDGASAYFLTE